MTATSSWRPPTSFEEYRLMEPLGRGAMGQVWLGHDTLLDRLVAIKFIADLHPGSIARERFLVEARAVARLSHPNVVAIHRVGVVERRPFIVSEYVRGVRLDALERPLPADRALAIAIGLARGLAAAHRRGVLHRDLKPENAMVSDTGEVKLLDFGLAKLLGESQPVVVGSPAPELAAADASPSASPALDATVADRTSDDSAADTREIGSGASPELTSAGMLMGTPLYLAPEIWKGEPATRRSDVYSLGALLYAVLSGRPPHRGQSLRHLGIVAATTDAAPLAEVADGVDRKLAAIVDHCLRRDPAQRYASAEELREALEQLTPDARVAELPEGNPYPGLRAFDAAFRGTFFGRGPDIRHIVDRLRNERVVVVAGDSGVGKSSLCRAGVIPAIEDGILADDRQWSSAVLTPGRHPVAELTAALARIANVDEGALRERLREDASGVARDVRRRLSDDRGAILLIDQMEELITLGDAGDREIVGEVLTTLAAGAPSVRILCTVRSDYLTAVAGLPAIGDEITRALHLLRPMTPDGLRAAVTGPARANGVEFESAEFVDELVAATQGAGALPVLQFTLSQLWETRDRDSRRITAAALEEIGGVDGALARHADNVLAAMLPAQRNAARRVLSRLVTADGTRAPVVEADLVADDPDAQAALRALVDGRLVVARQSDDGTVYEVAHEALIERWGALRDWLHERRDLRAARERVERAAAEWERLERRGDTLWSARQIQDLPADIADELNPRAREFLTASRRSVRRGRFARRAIAVAVVAVLAGGYGLFSWVEARKLARKVDERVDHAEQVWTQARAARERLERARATAFELFAQPDRDQAEVAWDEAQALLADVEREYAAAAEAFEAAVVLDSRRNDVRKRLAAVLYERAELADAVGRDSERDEALRRLRLHDVDGARLADWERSASVALSTTPAGASVSVARYRSEPDGTRALGDAREVGTTPATLGDVEPGSYLVTFRSPGFAEVRYPIVVERGASESIDVRLLRADDVPEGMIHVPAGRFLFGAGVDDQIRRNYYQTAPEHPMTIPGFLAARYETTYGEWFEFLRALPPEQRQLRMPKGATIGMTGAVRVTTDATGRFVLSIQPAGTQYDVPEDGALRYAARGDDAAHPVARLPVTGISPRDAEAYVSWLAASGRVPGARLCTEREWERLARGADDRIYPNGDVLGAGQANFGYEGSDNETYGPDAVGSHPDSRSPFGADDVAGNVWEWATSVYAGSEHVARGGAYQFDAAAATAIKHEAVAPDIRDITLGLRICADLPAQ